MTAVYAVLGWPVAHSRSPAMHNAAFAALSLDAVYVPLAIPPGRLPQAVAALRGLGIAGFNVTLPHKQAIMTLLDAVDEGARAIGAVNTVLRDGDRLLGTNTDGLGLAASLVHAGAVLQGASVVVLGTGGAARASVVGLAAAGARRIVVAGRRRAQAEALAAELGGACPSTQLATAQLVGTSGGTSGGTGGGTGGGADADGGALAAELALCSLLVQATSATLGETPQAEAFADALPWHALPATAVVCDLVYKPLRTAVLRRAAARGLRTVDGLGMLLHQGALAFSRWTGQPAPLSIMHAALIGQETR